MVHVVNVVHEFVPHARRRDDKTEALLDVAMRLVAEQGLEALTLQKVAAALGLVTTAIYRYFPSKDALVAALQRRAVGTLHAHFSEVRAEVAERTARLGPEAAALAPLLGLSRAYVALPETHPEAFRLVSILLGDPRRLVADEEAAKTAPLVIALLADMQSLFEQAASASAVARTAGASAADRTIILWATLHGLSQLEKLRRLAHNAPTARELCDRAATTILRGFGAEPDTLSRALRALDSTRASRAPSTKGDRS